jgi:hypothetical protein
MDGSQPKKRKWWQRPIVWLATVVIGAAGAYLTDLLVTGAKTVVPPEDVVNQVLDTPAIVVDDLTHFHDAFVGRGGYVVSAAVDPAPVSAISATLPPFKQWAEANNAVDLGVTAWEITIEGKRDSPVEVVNIVPVLEEPCGPALRGGLFRDGAQGETDKVVLNVDVSAAHPLFSRSDPSSEFDANYFGSKKISLPRGEKNVLILRATSGKVHCRWRYGIEYIADGKRGSLLVSAPGNKPFEVTAGRASADYDWIVPGASEVSCFHVPEGSARPKVAGKDFEAVMKACYS